MDTIETDIAIIGGGGAGLRAAIEAATRHPDMRIAVLSKVYPVRSHTVSAEGGIAGVIRDYDSFGKHCYDTIRGSDFLADQDAVEFFVNQAPREIIQLEHWGCPWSRESDGSIAVRAFGGMSVKRTVFAADKTGFYMLHTLFERSLKYKNIRTLDEWFVTRLIRTDSKIIGCIAINIRTGQLHAISAKAIILATGGAGKVYSFTTNAGIKTGDGMALALHAGVLLKDMEFVQFHPTGLPRTGILITEGARGEGGYLLNNKGERFMQRYLPSKMELGPRDIISRCIMQEIKEGRGFKSPYGDYIHLDIRHLGAKIINEKLPLVREISLDFAGIDPVTEPIPVMPVMHYFMGGVHTDIDGATELAGLYAAGETACVTINGANRLGSNSLAECVVFGAASGRHASDYAAVTEASVISESVLRDEQRRINSLRTNTGSECLAEVQEDLRRLMQTHAGIERTEALLREGIVKLQNIKQRAEHIQLTDLSDIFNTELIARLQLDSMLLVAEGILTAALARRESRGAHFRNDFPHRDDEKFLHHCCIKLTDGRMILSRHPVTITKWKPEPRVY